MRGYPKHVATKEDYLNLLNMSEYEERARNELQNILALNDNMIIVATTPIYSDNPEAGYNMEEIINPMPLWKQKGFSSLQDVIDTIVTSMEVV